MIVSFLFFIAQIIFGFCLFGFFDPRKKFSRLETLAAASAVGFTISSFTVFLLASLYGSLYPAIFIFSLVFTGVLIIRFKAVMGLFSYINGDGDYSPYFPKKNPGLLIFSAALVFYCVFLATVLYSEGGALKSDMLGWGDTALHISLIKRFAASEPFDMTHPMFSGVKLTYPFMVNFASGIYHKLGAGLLLSYRMTLYALGILSLSLVFSFARRVAKSSAFAALAVIFVLVGSGLGFFTLFDDIKNLQKSGGFSETAKIFTNPLHDYTHLDNRTSGIAGEKASFQNIVWIAPVNIFFAHQRTFTLGMSLFIIVLLGILLYGKEKEFWRYGIIAGLIPFCHAHSFMALAILMACLLAFYARYFKYWIKFAVITTMVALPQIIYFFSQSEKIEGSFLKPWFGWMTCGHNASPFFCDPGIAGTDTNAFYFWSKNFGVIFWLWILALIATLAAPLAKKYLSRFGLNSIFDFRERINAPFLFASLGLFVLPNLFLFQSWEFDNNKILFYWWMLAIIAGVIPLLKYLWEKKTYLKTAAMVLIFFAILAGSADALARVVSSKKINSAGYTDWLRENREMAEWIKNNTGRNDLFLTAPNIDPVPLFLAGRPVVMGYEGWLWTEGHDIGNQRTEIMKIFSGDKEKACEMKIKYILFDSELVKNFPGADRFILDSIAESVFYQTTYYETREILKINCD